MSELFLDSSFLEDGRFAVLPPPISD